MFAGVARSSREALRLNSAESLRPQVRHGFRIEWPSPAVSSERNKQVVAVGREDANTAAGRNVIGEGVDCHRAGQIGADARAVLGPARMAEIAGYYRP